MDTWFCFEMGYYADAFFNTSEKQRKTEKSRGVLTKSIRAKRINVEQLSKAAEQYLRVSVEFLFNTEKNREKQRDF
ncbi:MAG: hypothetical protein PHH43_04025 [Candidatus Cloacimonetes bacterium]|nr:hypothetical protein [Candidatus Cloacimonadota bacterium]MDD3235473.1 hypothetical protein [Candidatus Cloacimonadota bacterium]